MRTTTSPRAHAAAQAFRPVETMRAGLSMHTQARVLSRHAGPAARACRRRWRRRPPAASSRQPWRQLLRQTARSQKASMCGALVAAGGDHADNAARPAWPARASAGSAWASWRGPAAGGGRAASTAVHLRVARSPSRCDAFGVLRAQALGQAASSCCTGSASQRATRACTRSSPARTRASAGSQSRLAGRSLASTARPQAMLSSTETEVASLARHADRQLAARQHGGHAGVVQPAMEDRTASARPSRRPAARSAPRASRRPAGADASRAAGPYLGDGAQDQCRCGSWAPRTAQADQLEARLACPGRGREAAAVHAPVQLSSVGTPGARRGRQSTRSAESPVIRLAPGAGSRPSASAERAVRGVTSRSLPQAVITSGCAPLRARPGSRRSVT
jgi:hypothetical protein